MKGRGGREREGVHSRDGRKGRGKGGRRNGERKGGGKGREIVILILLFPHFKP